MVMMKDTVSCCCPHAGSVGGDSRLHTQSHRYAVCCAASHKDLELHLIECSLEDFLFNWLAILQKPNMIL